MRWRARWGCRRLFAARSQRPDTYTLAQGQDEFYFALPYAQMDRALWALDHGVAAAVLAASLGLSALQAQRVYDDIAAKRRAARYLHAAAETIEPLGPR